MVSLRKTKKEAKKQLREQGMSLDDAYKILDNAPSLVSKSVYEDALKLVEAEDAGFAAEIRAFNEAKEKEDALRAAYQIVGGYTNTISKNLYANAMKMVEADDPEFAQKLKTLFENGTNFKDADKEQLATAEQIVQNARTIEQEYTDDAQLRIDVIRGDVREIIDNTIVPDISEEDKENILFRTGMQEVIPEITENAEFANAQPKEKHKMLVSRIRDSIKRTLIRARLSSAEKPHNAFDFSKKVKVATKSIADAYETALKRTTSFINRLSAAGHKKAAIWLNKAKTKTHKAMVTLATTSVLLSSFLPSCRTDNANRAPEPMPANQKTFVLDDTTKTSASIVSDTIKNDSIPVLDVNVQAAATDSISVPTEWNADMGISESQWNRLQTYWGSRDKFEQFYKKISNDMLAENGIFANKTREQVLFQYERMSSWNLPRHQETIEAFDAFFGECGGEITKEQAQQLDDVLSDGSIKDVEGTLNRVVTGRDVDCEEGSTLHVQNFDKKANNNKQEFVLKEDGSSSVIVEEKAPDFTFDEKGSSRIISETRTDTIAPTVQVFKGNSLNDGKQIGTAGADEVVGKTVTAKENILVEDKATQVSTDSIDSTSKFVFEEDFVQTPSVNPDSLATSHTSTTVVNDSVAAGNPVSFTFVNDGGSSTFMTDTVATADSVQIVADSNDLPRGTPAAGNVPERGGYENSGLISKKQYTNLQGWYVTKYGDNAFEDVMEKITDDMLAKGGAFEGLSKEQALRVAEGIMVHSNLFLESAEALEAFLNPCKDAVLTVEQIEQIRKDGYNITEEGLVTDGVYNKGVYARFYKTGDCEEDGHVVYENTAGNVSTTRASNQYYGRLYQYKPTRTEPITYTFDQEIGSSRTEIKYVYKEAEPVVTLHKGNDLNLSESKHLGEVSAKETADKQVSNKENILVEQNAAPVTFTFEEEKGNSSSNFTFEEEKGSSQTVTTDTSKKTDKKAEKKAKKIRRQKQRAAEKAKKQQEKIAAEQRRAALMKYAGGQGGASQDYFRVRDGR